MNDTIEVCKPKKPYDFIGGIGKTFEVLFPKTGRKDLFKLLNLDSVGCTLADPENKFRFLLDQIDIDYKTGTVKIMPRGDDPNYLLKLR